MFKRFADASPATMRRVWLAFTLLASRGSRKTLRLTQCTDLAVMALLSLGTLRHSAERSHFDGVAQVRKAKFAAFYVRTCSENVRSSRGTKGSLYACPPGPL
ncbi:hypothetical protein BDV98DRAFT_572605 [Pterulicium gracile]|uniref:Uncharacterized protein n=1 Tax=Pterulicium gracile TaxID=1884261 RepID=A0A5C3QE50_9AGAR|nr:hypothetical protein BDV98DRAFT_572605 [Pterula gracilis]